MVIAVLVVVAGAIGASVFSRGGTEIDVIRPRIGEIRESFREPARTRLENTWSIAMQVTGRVGRVDLEPGDKVAKGQTLAEVDRIPFEVRMREAEANLAQLRAQLAVMDDNRMEEASIAEAEARTRAARQGIAAAMARVGVAQSQLDFAEKELKRIEALAKEGTVSQSALDNARLAARRATDDLSAAQATLASERANQEAFGSAAQGIRERLALEKLERQEILAQIQRAEALVETAKRDLDLAKVVSPIDGVVLERYERGERPLAEGSALLLLGNPADIETIADVLTEDALKLKPGGEVELESLSSDLKLKGHVKRIEPQGFTKLSSLGVEQQRVNVIASIDNAPPNLGVEFRLHARFFTATKPDALLVPRFSVLQAADQSYYVFVVENDKLKRRAVELGLRSDLWLEVRSGLTKESVIVSAPDTTLKDGAAVKPKMTGEENGTADERG